MLSYWLGDDLIIDHKLNKDLQKKNKSNSGIYEQEDEAWEAGGEATGEIEGLVLYTMI